MAALETLHQLCRSRSDLRLILVLIDPTNHRARRERIWPHGSLALRVVIGDGDSIVGRCQSEPGRETVDELAAGCLDTLRRKGLIEPKVSGDG